MKTSLSALLLLAQELSCTGNIQLRQTLLLSSSLGHLFMAWGLTIY
ncbi:hypothetical protein [Methylomonas fluvii]|uniref:Uncharacterized protein n=1 Tax=Methylomonas fluvii TaxID=1854564 RepID=A0ABR9DGF0_9GAMM|nr:hypothetical protein [Methylomonas fluvii]MBD9361388.1 hypothetical protein [Methylomonas fluvii]